MHIARVEEALAAYVMKLGTFPVLVRPRFRQLCMHGVLLAGMHNGVPVVYLHGMDCRARVTLAAAACRWARLARVFLVLPVRAERFPKIRRLVECTRVGVVVVSDNGEGVRLRMKEAGRTPKHTSWFRLFVEGSAPLHCQPGETMATAFSRVFVSALEEAPGSSLRDVYNSLPQYYASVREALKRARKERQEEYRRVMAGRVLFRM